MKQQTYNLSITESFSEAFSYFNYLKEKKAIVKIVEVKQTRTNQQNAALHLFFTWCAEALNDVGLYYKFTAIKGYELEMPWTLELFKENFWRPLQLVVTDKKSTTKLNRTEIDPIFDIICKWMGDNGISISFPNRFDYFLKTNL